MVRIPEGVFVTQDGAEVTITEPFWMAQCEVTNAQYAAFDPAHDSRIEDKHAYQFGVHGFPVNEPKQPVVRISPEQADAFCAWLSGVTGESFALPTEVQWEWACRAGAATPFHFGSSEDDFSPYANMADMKLREFADNPYKVYAPLANATPYDDWIPRDNRFNDGVLVSAEVGHYRPNAWGLHDMHGNVFEWCRDWFADYSNLPAEDPVNGSDGASRVYRGGAWSYYGKQCRSADRDGAPPGHKSPDLGFRVALYP